MGTSSQITGYITHCGHVSGNACVKCDLRLPPPPLRPLRCLRGPCPLPVPVLPLVRGSPGSATRTGRVPWQLQPNLRSSAAAHGSPSAPLCSVYFDSYRRRSASSLSQARFFASALFRERNTERKHTSHISVSPPIENRREGGNEGGEERREGGNGGGQCLCKLIRQRRRLHVSTGRGHIKCVGGGSCLLMGQKKNPLKPDSRQKFNLLFWFKANPFSSVCHI